MADFKFEITVHAPDDCLVELDEREFSVNSWEDELSVPITITPKDSILEEINSTKLKLEDLEIKLNKIEGGL